MKELPTAQRLKHGVLLGLALMGACTAFCLWAFLLQDELTFKLLSVGFALFVLSVLVFDQNCGFTDMIIPPREIEGTVSRKEAKEVEIRRAIMFKPVPTGRRTIYRMWLHDHAKALLIDEDSYSKIQEGQRIRVRYYRVMGIVKYFWLSLCL